MSINPNQLLQTDPWATWRELNRRKFSYFARTCWPIIEPAEPLIWNWALEALCDHLQAVFEGKIKRLLIALPPRHAKSSFTSVLFPAWVWLRNPAARFFTASYAQKLATRDSVRSRRVIQHEIYQRMRPGFELLGDQNEKMKYENTATGVRQITTPGSGTTGEGGNFIILDDPHNVQDVESETKRNEVLNWFDNAMSNRTNKSSRDSIIVMAQRTHEHDLIGHLLATGKYDYLCLPTLYEPEYRKPPTSIGFEDPRTEPGELLSPELFNAEAVEEAKSRGSWMFAAQYQQRPVTGKGNIFSRDWFRRWTTLPLEGEYIMSWDLSFKGRSEKEEIKRVGDLSFVVGDLWYVSGASGYLVDQVRGQWDFKTTLDHFRAFCTKHPQARRKLVEAKANGPALESALHSEIPGIVMVEPRGSKVQRAFACQPYVEAGNIYIPDSRIFPDAENWLNEVCAFPFAVRDDRVDAMTQFINYQFNSQGSASLHRLRMLVTE